MKDPFANFSIAAGSGFGGSKTISELQRWVTNAGGELMSNVGPRTTHLVCSEEQWKSKTPLVKAALEHPKVKIVSFDWVEDCLRGRTRRSTTKYEFSTSNRQPAKRARKRAATATPAKKKQLMANAKVNTTSPSAIEDGGGNSGSWLDGHTIYSDPEGFSFVDRLRLPDSEDGQAQSVRLCLLENKNVEPPTYACTATYITPICGSTRVSKTLAEPGSTLDFAMSMWRVYYSQKTGCAWVKADQA